MFTPPGGEVDSVALSDEWLVVSAVTNTPGTDEGSGPGARSGLPPHLAEYAKLFRVKQQHVDIYAWPVRGSVMCPLHVSLGIHREDEFPAIDVDDKAMYYSTGHGRAITARHATSGRFV